MEGNCKKRKLWAEKKQKNRSGCQITVNLPSPNGTSGALMWLKGLGVPFAKTIVKMGMPGAIFRLISLIKKSTDGERMGLQDGAIDIRYLPLLLLFGMGKILF